MNIEKIHFAGKERPITFSMATVMYFQEETGVAYEELFSGKELKPSQVYMLVYQAFRCGAQDAGDNFDLTFSELVNEAAKDTTAFGKVWAILEKLIQKMGEIFAEDEETDGKKLPTGAGKKKQKKG